MFRAIRRPLLGFTLVTGLALGVPASAATIFSSDFNSLPNGSDPADFDNNAAALSSADNIAVSNGTWRNDNGGLAALYYDGTPGSTTLTDTLVETEFRRGNGGGFLGLIARVDTTTAPASRNYYHLRLESNNTFRLYDFTNNGAFVLATDILSGAELYPSTSPTWKMQLEAIGTTITGRLFNTGGDLVSEISVTDTTHTAGAAGIYSQGGVNVYDSLTITSIPEPASLGLMAIGCVLLINRRKR